MFEIFSKYYPLINLEIYNDSKKICINDFQNKNILGCLLYKENHEGKNKIHINAILVQPEFRRKKVATSLLNIIKTKSNKLTANVLFSETYNILFWEKNKFKMVEINDKEKCIVFEYNKEN